jgi:hypothetical protein
VRGQYEAVAPAIAAFHDDHDDAVLAVGENGPFDRRHLHQVGPFAVPDHLAVRFVELESPSRNVSRRCGTAIGPSEPAVKR